MFGKSYINKIFVDSRYKTSSSNNDSDFVVELNENVELNEGVGCVITDITLPHTWYNVNQNNNNFFWRTINGSGPVDYVTTLTPQNYTIYDLAKALQTDMNRQTGLLTNGFSVEADVQAGTLIISVGTTLQFMIFNDVDLGSRVNGTWRGPFFNSSNLKSMNSMLRINGLALRVYDQNTSFSTGFVDLLPFHSLYITSTKLSNFNNMGPGPQRNVVKKVLVNSNFGEVNTFDYVFSEDKVDVSNITLRLLDFQIRDAFGNIIDLQGASVSFAILFVKM